MAEFHSLKEAIKFSKVNTLSEITVPAQYVKFVSLTRVNIIVGFDRVNGVARPSAISLTIPPYILPIISRLFTNKSTTYSLLSSLSEELAVGCLNDVFSKHKDSVYIAYVNGGAKCIVPNKYTFLPNEYILNGMINQESEANVVNILMCEHTKIMRLVYTHGDSFKTQAGTIKKAVVVLNSEIGMLDYKTVKRSSLVAFPAIWYCDKSVCAIVNGKGIEFVAIDQLNKRRNDILLDFVVDIEMRKLHDVAIDVHEKMLQERVEDNVKTTVRSILRHIDLQYLKSLQKNYDGMSVFSLYNNILARTNVYTPQFRVKIEKLCGGIYGRYYD